MGRLPTALFSFFLLAMAAMSSLMACSEVPQPEFSTKYDCNAEQGERVFLECLKAAQHMGGSVAPGNDSDEVVVACKDAAHAISCTYVWACVKNCHLLQK